MLTLNLALGGPEGVEVRAFGQAVSPFLVSETEDKAVQITLMGLFPALYLQPILTLLSSSSLSICASLIWEQQPVSRRQPFPAE